MNILSDVSVMKDFADKAGSHYSKQFLEAEYGSRDRAWFGFKTAQSHSVFWALAAKENNERLRNPLYAGDDAVSKAERNAIRAESKLYKARAEEYYAEAEQYRREWLSL